MILLLLFSFFIKFFGTYGSRGNVSKNLDISALLKDFQVLQFKLV